MREIFEVLTKLYDTIEDQAMACDEFCGHYVDQLDAVSFVARQVLTPEEFEKFYDCGTADPADAYTRYNREGRGEWFGGIYCID